MGPSYFGAICGPEHVFLLFRDGPYLNPVPLPREALEGAARIIVEGP